LWGVLEYMSRVGGVRVTEITGSRTDGWIHWCNFIITISYDSSESVTVYDSLSSLMNHERLLFAVTNDERRIPAHTLNCLERLLSVESTLIPFWLLTDFIVWVWVWVNGQSASPSWNKAPIRGFWPYFYHCQTVAGLLVWSAFSDERTDVSITVAAGPRQRVSWDSWPYFTVSESKLPFLSPPMTRMATMEVSGPTSTRNILSSFIANSACFTIFDRPCTAHLIQLFGFSYLL
jgi:hypothetical protein